MEEEGGTRLVCQKEFVKVCVFILLIKSHEGIHKASEKSDDSLWSHIELSDKLI